MRRRAFLGAGVASGLLLAGCDLSLRDSIFNEWVADLPESVGVRPAVSGTAPARTVFIDGDELAQFTSAFRHPIRECVWLLRVETCWRCCQAGPPKADSSAQSARGIVSRHAGRLGRMAMAALR
jgi:hypothetical protein